MNKIVRWFINLTSNDSGLFVGQRVKTKYGMGVVTSGSVQVKLDKTPPGAVHENEKTWSFNLNEM